MNPNPFSPPTAKVTDGEGSMRPLPPRRVYIACALILLAFVFGLLALLPGVHVPEPDEPPVPVWFTVALVLVFGGITWWFVLKMLHGRNWARWATLVYLAIGWLLMADDATGSFAESPLEVLIGLVCVAMEVAASWMLFTGAAAVWFQEEAARGRPGAR